MVMFHLHIHVTDLFHCIVINIVLILAICLIANYLKTKHKLVSKFKV